MPTIRLDLDSLSDWLRAAAPTLAGALFSVGLFLFLDALLCAPTRPPPTFFAPGAGAAAALLALQLVPRYALADLDAAYDPAGATRARAWLFACFVASAACVAGAVSVAASAPPALAHVGGAVVGQTGLTLASALLLWGFRSNSDFLQGGIW